MDIIQLYRDFNISFVTEHHKHSRPGWVNCECPFCSGNPGYHLGYDTNDDKFVCWRCGGKWSPQVISALCKVGITDAFQILRQYGNITAKSLEKKRKIEIKKFHLPPNSDELTGAHVKYLQNRGFDVEKLVKLWDLKGTGIYSKMDNIDYSRRIVIPYYWNAQIVSFDTRDITGKAQNKYMACTDTREKISHKNILYGNQQYWTDSIIVVEGCTDVWRMGVHSVATSGIKYKPAQVRELAKRFKKVAVMFDGESETSKELQAREQAAKLIGDLRFRGVDAFRVDINGDPGGLSQEDADYIVKQIIK